MVFSCHGPVGACIAGATLLKTVNLIAGGLLILFVVIPSVLLGLYVAPWFFLLMVLLAVVPLFFWVRRGAD
jgi:hypothetical protein